MRLVDKPIIFLGQHIIPFNKIVDSTIVGGISSIDYHKGLWYLLSDDRSEYNNARFYEATILYNAIGIDSIIFNKTVFLQTDGGQNYEKNSIDPEALRFNPATESILYTSEGGRKEVNKAPFIREAEPTGQLRKTFKIPAYFNFFDSVGLRRNGGLESLAIENDTIIWFANELPLMEDGEVPAYKQEKRPVRLVRFDIKNNEAIEAFPYMIEPVQAEAVPKTAFNINSVTELLALSSTRLLVLERSYITGVGNYVKLFEVNTAGATDILKHAWTKKY